MNSGFPGLRVDLDRLRRGPVEWTGDLPAEAAAWALDELDFATGPRLRYRAEPGGHGGVRVIGRLEATLRLECRRCLRELLSPLEIEFDFRFDPSVEEWEEESSVFTLDPDAAALYLLRPIREELVLALPGYPVCREGCRGLCPVCGADLNESACGCTKEQSDPRWDILKKMPSDADEAVSALDDERDGNEGQGVG